MAALAGMFFGIYPLFLNRSGLTGVWPVALFSALVLTGTLSVALYGDSATLQTIGLFGWAMLLSAGIFGTFGMLAFCKMIAEALPKDIGMLIALMTIVQIAVAAIYQAVMSGGQMSIDKIGGYVAAGVAAYLLLR